MKDGQEMRTLVLILTITCTAPLELWSKDFGDLTAEQRELFNQGKIPCREYGTLSHLCNGCQFGSVETDEGDWADACC